MSGFWEYIKQFSDDQNRSRDALYQRQFNLGQMLSSNINEAQQGLMSLLGLQSNIADRSATYKNWDVDRSHKTSERLGAQQFEEAQTNKGFEHDIYMQEMRNKNARDLAALEHQYAMTRQSVADANERKRLDLEYSRKREILLKQQKEYEREVIRQKNDAESPNWWERNVAPIFTGDPGPMRTTELLDSPYKTETFYNFGEGNVKYKKFPDGTYYRIR